MAIRDEPAGPDACHWLLASEDGEDLTGGVFVAQEGPAGEIAGFVAVDGDEITMLYVDPSWRRCGVGRALLRHAVLRCGPETWVEALAGNAVAIMLYQSEGFRAIAAGMGKPAAVRMRRTAARS